MVTNIPSVIEEQTRLKHKLLESYIEKWMGILYNNQVRINEPELLIYIDGFSGPGVYFDDETKTSVCDGSPIIVAKIANKYIDDRNSREFIIISIDDKKECVKSLNNIFNKENIYDQQWKAHHADFDTAVNQIFNEIDDKNLQRFPIFIFIDPFGWSGFPMETLKRLLKYPRVELFINFMIYNINRFIDADGREQSFYDLFNSWDFRECSNDETQAHIYLKNLYCQQIVEHANAKFVMPFRVNTPRQGTRPKYYLIHASNHIKALKEMKNCMSKLSESDYSFEAIGLAPDQFNLFEDPEKTTLRERILEYCKDHIDSEILFEDLELWAYINTNGVRKTIQNSLIELERNETINISRKKLQRKNTVTKGAIIKYIS